MIAKACIFLSAKVEEQPRRLEHVINTAHFILNTGTPSNPRVYQPLDLHSDVRLLDTSIYLLFWSVVVFYNEVLTSHIWLNLKIVQM